jgi:hypothetical protein
MISKVSVHDWLVPLLWDCGETEHNGREQEMKQSHSPHGGQEAERAVTGRGGDKIYLSRAHPFPSELLLQQGPNSYFSPPPNNAVI